MSHPDAVTYSRRMWGAKRPLWGCNPRHKPIAHKRGAVAIACQHASQREAAGGAAAYWQQKMSRTRPRVKRPITVKQCIAVRGVRPVLLSAAGRMSYDIPL